MSTFVINRPDGSATKVSGYKFAAPREGSKTYSARRDIDAPPPRVDLRPYMTSIENQEQTNSCVANAVAGAYEYLVKRHMGEEAYDVSRLFIYYNARAQGDEPIEDEGSMIADAIEGLRQHGACSEETWPFDAETVNEEPSEEAYEEASQFPVEEVENVPTDLDAWRRCLAEGNPIVFGISLFQSFDAHRKKGVVPMPSKAESSRESHGGHAMLCVGYSDKDKVFIVRNSWGSDWGDEGYCYIPYSYIMNPELNGGDSWIIRRLESFDMDEDTWGDESSIVTDVGGDLSAMTEEEFTAMLDAMGDFPLETRIALLFLYAAGADGDISDDEIAEIAGYMSDVLEQIGSRYSAEKVLKNALRNVVNEDLIEESIQLLGEHLSKSALAGIVARMQEVVGVDGLSDDEENVVNQLVEAWQIEEGE
jgi:hypothetical protein